VHELHAHRQCQELEVSCLPTPAVSQYLADRFPQAHFSGALGPILHERTEGNPLFMVNIVDSWVSQRLLVEQEGRWLVTTPEATLATGLPESVRQVIVQQVGRLPLEMQRMLEVASVAGGEFSAAALAAGGEEPTETMEAWCDGLAKQGRFMRVCGTET